MEHFVISVEKKIVLKNKIKIKITIDGFCYGTVKTRFSDSIFTVILSLSVQEKFLHVVFKKREKKIVENYIENITYAVRCSKRNMKLNFIIFFAYFAIELSSMPFRFGLFGYVNI